MLAAELQIDAAPTTVVATHHLSTTFAIEEGGPLSVCTKWAAYLGNARVINGVLPFRTESQDRRHQARREGRKRGVVRYGGGGETVCGFTLDLMFHAVTVHVGAVVGRDR